MISKICNLIKDFCNCLAKPAKDKILHFLIGYIAFDYTLNAYDRLGLHYWITFVLAFVTVTICMVVKELIDKKNYNTFDIFDLIAGYLGILLKIGAFYILVV